MANKGKHYVDNEKLYEAMKTWKEKYNATPEGEPKPRIPEYVGESIMKIAEGVSNMRRFYNYPFKEEMISDAILTCVKYIHNFDHERFNSPYSYITRVVYLAFISKIKKEKAELVSKQVMLQKLYFEGLLADQNIEDHQHQIHVELDNPYMAELVENEEKKKEEAKKKASTVRSKKKSVKTANNSIEVLYNANTNTKGT